MKTTTVTVNAECPGCGKACPPKLGIPGSSQLGWVWDDITEQRWCRACHADLKAKRHFEARGWVWKVTLHDAHGDRVKYVDDLTGWHATAQAWGRATVTIVSDPSRPLPEDMDWEAFAEDLAANGPDVPDYTIMVSEDTADALREELD